MKKLITLLILFVGMVSTVSADVTIRVKKGTYAPNIYAWYGETYYTGGWPGVTFNTEEEIYGETFYTWTASGANDLNIKFNYGGSETGTITLHGAGIYYFDYGLGTSATELLYFSVVGNNTTLFGSPAWAVDLDNNMMTKTGDNTYQKTYENVSLTAGTIEYKVVKNGTSYFPTGDNKSLTIPKTSVYDVTITMSTSGSWSLTATATEKLHTWYLVGKNNSWGTWDDVKKKSLISSDDVLELDKAGSVFSESFTRSDFSGGFVLISNLNLDADNYLAWKDCLRPNSDGDTWDLTFTNFVNQTPVTDNQEKKKWIIKEDNPAEITFAYNAETNKWSVSQELPITINASAGYATFSSAYNVAIPDGVTAYFCKGIDGSKELEMDTFSGGIPANQGALLHGKGDVTFTPAASTPSTPGTNWLKPGTGDPVLQTDGAGNTNFILTNNTVNGSADLKFYKVNSEGNTVPAGKAYLQIPSGYVGAHEYFWFEDETTGIEAAKAAQKMNGEFFNLAGQRVAQPTKGLYIVNGKKVIMK